MFPTLFPADLGRGVRGGFTSRQGGVSVGDFDSLNLSETVGDQLDAVTVNRARVADLMGAPVVSLNQVHSNYVRIVRCAEDADDIRGDAMVSDASSVALAIAVADCVPVLLADPERRVIAAAHVGRRGLISEVLAATIAEMADLGAEPTFIRASIGPSICGQCYEVPSEMRESVADQVPGTASVTSWGTPALDLPAGVRHQLAALGLTSVHALGLCTLTDTRFFSYRRKSTTGRNAGVIRLETLGHR